LKDHYLRFWFRYVHPNRSQLERGGAQLILENQVLAEIDHFSSLAFEEICGQHLWREGLAGRLSFLPVNIGRWWNAADEIDLVAVGEKDALLVECKWSKQAVGANILTDLERKAALIRAELGDRSIQYALCSRSGFTPQWAEHLAGRADVLLLNLPQIIRQD